MKQSLLLEIGLEEIPARFVRASSEQLRERMQDFLVENRVEFKDIEIFSTPRRLAVLVNEIADKQSDLVKKAKGPARKIAQDAEGNWTKAATGFARGQGVDVDDLYFETLKGVDYIYANKEMLGEPTEYVLKNLSDVITSMHFPVTMHWADHSFEYIRPIHWIVALLGDEIVPFNLLDVQSGRVSQGHRFLGEAATIANATDYEAALEKEFVVTDLEKRKAMILEQMRELEQKHGWHISVDADLLEEVVSLVEYPTAFYGEFDEKYLSLPEEVLTTSMKEHQRFFSVMNTDGSLAPYFISVRNGNAEYIETVKRGNEKVLTARLEDALFFYEEDKKITIESSMEKLANVSFHAKIGSITAKMNRTAILANKLAELAGFSEEETANLQRAAQIYKFDLVSNMVSEFPELQGKMGEEYALLHGENPAVAAAIREHYLPLSSESALPETKVGAVLAAADKLDSIISFFIYDMIPTGSNDPYALRRQMIGIVEMIDTYDQSFGSFDFYAFLSNALTAVYGIKEAAHNKKVMTNLMSFVKARIQQNLQKKRISHDIQESILTSSENNLHLLLNNATELQSHQNDVDFKDVIEALSRVINISTKAETGYTINVDLFDTPSEKNLYVQINHLETIWDKASIEEKYDALKNLEPYIIAYFEENMVMVPDDAVRHNRLAMLAKLAEKIISFADVRKLIIK